MCAHLAAALGREPDPHWHVTVAFLGDTEPVDLAAAVASGSAVGWPVVHEVLERWPLRT